MAHHGQYILVCLVAAGILIYLTTGAPHRPSPASKGIKTNCDIDHGPCTLPMDSGAATLDISPKPVRAMTDLAFRLILTGLPVSDAEHPEEPFIDLDMPDMFMGYNRIHLTRKTPGVYVGKGVIVRCPSGIPTWKAVVTVPDTGEATFVFDVRY